MFPIRQRLIFICILLALVVPRTYGQARVTLPGHLKGEWTGSFSWKRDTTSYPVSIDFRSPNFCRLSIMDDKVHLGLQVESTNKTQTTFVVDPDISDPNPLFIGAHLTVTKLSDYLSCVYQVSFAFEGEDELWSGFLFRVK
jgi:hypothetical protein